MLLILSKVLVYCYYDLCYSGYHHLYLFNLELTLLWD